MLREDRLPTRISTVGETAQVVPFQRAEEELTVLLLRHHHCFCAGRVGAGDLHEHRDLILETERLREDLPVDIIQGDEVVPLPSVLFTSVDEVWPVPHGS